VLEIGVGSGYQTAILAELCGEVIGLERISALASEAANRLNELGYHNVTIHVADGTEGYIAKAPYDAIVVAAAAPSIPEPLMAQLANNGRLVIPIGEGDQQKLELVIRKGESLHIYCLTPVRFVPLIGKYGHAPG
jgi:protein-L-isoaspartate(D-aspartate) O-methyltransferase